MTNPYFAEKLAAARHEDLVRAGDRARRIAALHPDRGSGRRLPRRPRWHR